MNRVKVWIEKIISTYRKEYQNLSGDEKKRVSNLDDFMPNCQIELIQFENPEYQILLVTHFDDEPDMVIFVHQPIPIQDIINKLENIAKDKKWNKRLSEESAKRYLYKPTKTEMFYRTLLEKFLSRAYQRISQDLMVKYEKLPIILGKTMIMERDFGWLIRGDLSTSETSAIIDAIIKEAKKKLPEKTPPQRQEPERAKGYGTFFYPPIWIGEMPKFTFREKLGIGLFRQHCTKVFKMSYRDNDLVVYRDGQIGISEVDKEKALRMLNEIMAVSTLKDAPSFAIREIELQDIQIDPNTFEIVGSSGSLVSLRTNLDQDRWGTSCVTTPLPLRTNVAEEKMRKIIKLSEKLTDRKQSDLLILNLEAYTHYHETEYMQSFVLGWVVIEKYLSNVWRKFIEEFGVTGKRKKKLLSSHEWSISYIIETLNLCGKFDKDLYQTLIELKKRRDKSVHEGESITQDDAKKCLTMSSKVVSEILRRIENL